MPVAAIEEQKLCRRIRELARRHVRWGRRLVYRRLRFEGWSVNHKRVQRIWREEELRAEDLHHVWAIDFQFE
jgi:hypothetical protein